MAAPRKPAARRPTDAEQPSAADSDAAAVEGSDITRDYTRRAGGYRLTERGWVLVGEPGPELVSGEGDAS